MRFFLWQSILLGFAAKSTAIYQGDITTDPDAVGVVRIQFGNEKESFGSGVVIGNGNCVITAAHVVKSKNPSDLRVFKNEVGKGKITQKNTWVEGSKIHIPSQYHGNSDPEDTDPSAYDFAVVELASPMDTSPWKVSQSRGDYQDVTLYGWGSTSKAPAKFPAELRSAVDKNRDIDWWDQCSDWRNLVGAICIMNISSWSPDTAPPEGLNCHGDSGGPAVTKGYVVGVTSGTNRICGFQTAGLLAGVSGSNQEAFMKQYKSTCGFEFGSP